MGEEEGGRVVKVFSFIIVMSIQVIAWRSIQKQLKDDIDEAYDNFTPDNVLDPYTYFVNTMMLKRENAQQPPFTILTLGVYIVFAYASVLLAILVAYCVYYLFNRFILLQCLLGKDKTDLDENYILNVLKKYVLDHFVNIIECVCICVCIVVILAIIISVFFKPVFLDKQKTLIIVDSIMWMFLGLIPFVMLGNYVIKEMMP
jgi:hypothetical protein